jgi:hypothetical protein
MIILKLPCGADYRLYLTNWDPDWGMPAFVEHAKMEDALAILTVTMARHEGTLPRYSSKEPMVSKQIRIKELHWYLLRWAYLCLPDGLPPD